MNAIANFPYTEIEFTKDGTIFKPAVADDLLHLLADTQTTDLLVVSHGWNNDMDEARDLYKQLITGLAAAIQQRPKLAGQKFAVLGVLWPAKKFADDDQIAGGAASLDTQPAVAGLLDRLTTLQTAFDGANSSELIQQAIDLVPSLAADDNARSQYVSLIQQLISPITSAQHDEPEDFPANNLLTAADTSTELLTRLSNVQPFTNHQPDSTVDNFNVELPMSVDGEGRAADGTFGFGGLVDGARQLLNFATYYQMKERAGKVGLLGLHPVLAQVRQERPACRLHLVGHSFGARLVTAATNGPVETQGLPVQSLSLLQGAFSQYGFAAHFEGPKNGLFRSVLSRHKVTGPILVSQTHNDKAVGLAYAVASRIAGQTGEAIGDANDLFGGLGANGAQRTPETTTQFTLDPGVNYVFQPGLLYNLNADQTIPSHSEIFHPQVSHALASAIEVA